MVVFNLPLERCRDLVWVHGAPTSQFGYAVGKGDKAMKGVGGSDGVSETALVLIRPSSLAINVIK